MKDHKQKGHPTVLNLACSWPAKPTCLFLSVLCIYASRTRTALQVAWLDAENASDSVTYKPKVGEVAGSSPTLRSVLFLPCTLSSLFFLFKKSSSAFAKRLLSISLTANTTHSSQMHSSLLTPPPRTISSRVRALVFRLKFQL